MMVQQTARLLHKLKKPRVMLKLDIAKAIDSVSGLSCSWYWKRWDSALDSVNWLPSSHDQYTGDARWQARPPDLAPLGPEIA
jgi:hypothetical protein